MYVLLANCRLEMCHFPVCGIHLIAITYFGLDPVLRFEIGTK